MKKTEFLKDIQGKSLAELNENARALSEELMKMRFRRVTGQVEQSHRFREVRRNLARVKTAIAKLVTDSKKAA